MQTARVNCVAAIASHVHTPTNSCSIANPEVGITKIEMKPAATCANYGSVRKWAPILAQLPQ